jgi:hypothetical protein
VLTSYQNVGMIRSLFASDQSVSVLGFTFVQSNLKTVFI